MFLLARHTKVCRIYLVYPLRSIDEIHEFNRVSNNRIVPISKNASAAKLTGKISQCDSHDRHLLCRFSGRYHNPSHYHKTFALKQGTSERMSTQWFLSWNSLKTVRPTRISRISENYKSVGPSHTTSPVPWYLAQCIDLQPDWEQRAVWKSLQYHWNNNHRYQEFPPSTSTY